MTRNVWRQIGVPPILLAAFPEMKAYQMNVADGHLSVFVGIEGDEGWHLSISHRTNALLPGRYPSWDEITDARYRFVPDEVYMMMMLPPKAEYVNVHATTFHLWQTWQEQ